jgi:solute carrier family 25 carnitine/acylcarnitine transporter 20/29
MSVAESLQRQVFEVQALQAMYGESEIECSDARLEEAQAAIDAEDPTLFLHEIELTLQIDGAKLSITLPHAYPNKSAPCLSLTSDAMSRAEQDVLLSQLRRISKERTMKGDDGEECLLDLIQELQDLHDTHKEQASVLLETPVVPNGMLVLWIDHMNDFNGYTKKVQQFAQSEGLVGTLYFTKRARAEDVCVVLQGEPSRVSGFMAKLRTNYVDLNSKGLKCKERKMRVLYQSHAPGDACLDVGPSVVCTEYSGKDELYGMLVKLCPCMKWADAMRDVMQGAVMRDVMQGAVSSSLFDCVEATKEQAVGSGSSRAVDHSQKGRRGGSTAAASSSVEHPRFLTVCRDCIRINCTVRPGKSTTHVHLEESINAQEEELAIDLAAQAQQGAANAELIAAISKLLKVPKASVSISTGAKSRQKAVQVQQLTADEAWSRLQGAVS